MPASVDTPASGTGEMSVPRRLMTRGRWIEVGRILLTGLLITLYWREVIPFAVLLGAVAFGLYPLIKEGLRGLIRERKIGTELFVTIATVIAVAGGETIAGAVLLVIILIAEFIAELNTDRARASIHALIGAVPQMAVVRKNGSERQVSIAELHAGDVILVRAGERIPTDGIVRHGAAAVNEAAITGESLPAEKALGSEVFAGTLVEAGALDIEVTRLGADTLYGRIIALVEHAEEQRAPVQKLADRVAAWLIPAVLVFLVGVYLITRDVRLIVTLLIFTSPAELGLATPLVMIAAIARAARGGVLVKGGAHLETLAKADAIVFDKTGTLTVGRPSVTRIEVLDAALEADRVLSIAAAADRRSAHPLAKAVVDLALARCVTIPEPTAFQETHGRGVEASIDGHRVLFGNRALFLESGIVVPPSPDGSGRTILHLAVDDRVVAAFHLTDEPRPGARASIADLKRTGVKRIVMLTGDNVATARQVATALGIDEVEAELLPEDKVRVIERLQAEGHLVAMVGDGVNDAPALARADVGIAMGAAGTRAALEAADIALMTDDLSRIVFARALARRAYRTIKENLLVGVGVVHVAGIVAALCGLIGPIQAALIHLGPDVLVFLNSVKLLRVRIDAPERLATHAEGETAA